MAMSMEAVFNGKYEILKEIGRGGMSVVYLAMDKHLNKQWAIKEIRKTGKDKKGTIYVQSLMTEANLMKRLDHPAIPRIVDIVENSEAIYVVMDYVEGESLDKVLEKFGPQPQDVVLDWAKQLADALNYLHSQNPPIIYRDMKPANVMLKPEGTVKLIDFGTAREYKGTNIADTVVLGTPGYAAPEQYGKRETDGRTDIYCLGMTMHYLLTGQNPCDTDYEYFPVRYWNLDIHEGIERIIERCVRPDPADRFQNCTELLYALENYEYDTAEYKKTQKRKVNLFYAALGLSVAMFAVSIIGFITANAINRSNYDELINIPVSSAFEDKVNSYEEAVNIDPTRIEAYDKLIDAFEDNGSFGKSESNKLSGLFDKYQNNGDTDSVEYLELNYRIGFTYFNFYKESDNSTIQSQMGKSREYFETIHNTLAEHPDLKFDKEDVAESYYIITKFYKENSQMQLEKSHTKAELDELISAFDKCLDYVASLNEDEERAAQAIKISQCSRLAEQLNALRNEFRSVGIDQSTIQNLYNKIESIENSVELASLSDKKAKALKDCAAFKDNLAIAYFVSEGA